MKNKRIITILLLFISLFGYICVTSAATVRKGRVQTTVGLRLRTSASSSASTIIIMPYNATVHILEDLGKGSGCNTTWGKLEYEANGQNYVGYACLYYIEDQGEITLTNTVTVDNHSVEIPVEYTNDKKNDVIRFTKDNITYFIGFKEDTYNSIKSNKDKLIGNIKVRDDISITTTSSEVKTISDIEFVVAKGTDSYYLVTNKGGITGSIFFGAVGNITEENLVKVYKELTITEKYVVNDMARMTDSEFEAYLTNQGFPESYKVKLRALHKKHPTWVFKGTKTKYSWSDALKVQDEFAEDRYDSSPGNSFLHLVQSDADKGYEALLSTQPNDYNWYTDLFQSHDGSGWYQANRQTVAHFMDPRNYLSESSIFMFQDLTYDKSYQTEDIVKVVLYSSYMKQFSPYFIEAAETHNANPIFLAALVRQEVGTSTTNICSNGQAGVLADGVDYTGYYNFFNIGASSSSNPKLRSLQTAKANGWDSPKKSIVEGATFISRNYIANYQHTLYYQKYNFHPNETKGIWHQYTTNINSLEPQSEFYYTSYKSGNVLETAFVFDIPIFTNMSESSPLPKLGNPNNYMKEIKVNGLAISNFDGAVEDYTVNIPYTEKVKIEGIQVAKKTAIVNGLGTFDMTSDTITKKIIVTSGNGVNKTYTLTINREPKEVDPTPVPTPEPTPTPDPTPEPTPTPEPEEPTVEPKKLEFKEIVSASSYKTDDTYLYNITYGTSVSTLISNLQKHDKTISITVKDKNGNNKTSGTIGTGDKVLLSTGDDTKTITIVIYGDSSGDGKISAIDLLNVQKVLLKQSSLSGACLKAMDTNRDSKVTAIDLLNVQKHILGVSNISQG